jgi:hypothetical protein
MISESAQPIYIYPDQLVTETWPNWVESILSKCPADEFKNSRGFQQLIGNEDSTARTRASESYRIGLLLHRLISERSSGTNTMPKGWEYVCNNKPVLSKTGYLAYSIGKALSKNPTDQQLLYALNILYLIFSMSIGTESSGVSISTLLVYRRVLHCFRNQIGASDFDESYEEYSRWLAGAVFNTLDSSTNRQLLINEYINSDSITTLVLENEADKSIHSVTAEILKEKISTGLGEIPEINKITRHKAALFWAAPNRGIYSKASQVGLNLIDKLIDLDRESLASNKLSILDSVLRVNGSNEHQLLESINALLIKNISTSLEWGNLMENLSKGVYAALAYIEDTVEQVSKPIQFHLHGAPEIPKDTEELFAEVRKEGMPIKPVLGVSVLIQSVEYKLIEIEEQELFFKIKLVRV